MSPIRDVFEGRTPRPPLIGRIRLGVFEGRPKPTDTFVFTSQDRLFLEPLARTYGGEVERYQPQGQSEQAWRLISEADAITVLFPFAEAGQNLSQDYELWGAGGIKRRCDGFEATTFDVDEQTGEVLSAESPCLCRDLEERECQTVTRLRCWMPQTGLGLWELRTTSRYALFEVHDEMELLESQFAGRMQRIPVRLAYHPRRIRYVDQRDGKRRSTTKRLISVTLARPFHEIVEHLESERPLAAAMAAIPRGGDERALPSSGAGAPPVGSPEHTPASDAAPPGGVRDLADSGSAAAHPLSEPERLPVGGGGGHTDRAESQVAPSSSEGQGRVGYSATSGSAAVPSDPERAPASDATSSEMGRVGDPAGSGSAALSRDPELAPSSEDGEATDEQWRRAEFLYGSKTKVLRAAHERFGADVRKEADLTADLLQILIEARAGVS